MKKYFKICKYYCTSTVVQVILIFIIAAILRLYNFPNRITFGSEQARSLYVAASYIKDKPSLLGQEYFRTNSLGHKLFASSIFNYSLVPLLIIFKYNPIPISYYFFFLNLFTGFAVYWVAKKIFKNKYISILSLILFLFNSYMIYHSMFIWILNYMPLIGVLSFYLSYKIIKKQENFWNVLLLGVLSGTGFGFEYLYIIAIFIIIFVLIKFSKNKLKNLLIFIVGGSLGDITQIIFDFKHNFYHLKTLWQYTLDTFNGVSDAGFTYYHFLHFWPAVLIFLSFAIYLIYKKSKFIALLFVALYLLLNLKSNIINLYSTVGMPNGLNIRVIQKTSEAISNDADGNFNVVTLYDFDTRGYVLRYFVKFVYDKSLLSELDYPSSDIVYALASDSYDFNKNNPWELNVIKPYNIEKLQNIGQNFGVFKLKRI